MPQYGYQPGGYAPQQQGGYGQQPPPPGQRKIFQIIYNLINLNNKFF